MMFTLLAILKALPEIFSLFSALESGIQKYELTKTSKQSAGAIAKAFATGDSSALDAVFNDHRVYPPGAGGPSPKPES